MPKRTFFRLDEDKRERVIRKAIDEFRANGFENAKIGTIAQNASIANGSIYQYFEDKKELFLYCVNWTVENFIREIERLTPIAGMDLFEYFQTSLTERVAFWKQEPALAMFAHDLLNGRLDFPPGEENTVRDLYGAHIPRLISNGHKWGTLRDDIDDGLLELFFRGVAREVEDRLFSEAVSSGFELTKEQTDRFDETIMRTITILKDGMALKKPAAAPAAESPRA